MIYSDKSRSRKLSAKNKDIVGVDEHQRNGTEEGMGS
jgi:hypothetical protein